MSKVTAADVCDFSEYDKHPLDWQKAVDTPIVPRKMVEMIIKKCEEDSGEHYRIGNYCASLSVAHIGNYAKDLLKQFEGDDDE